MSLSINIVNVASIVDLKPVIWLFEKINPDYPILVIDYSELPLLKSVYQKHQKRVSFNGETLWLNPKQAASVEKNFKLDQIGFKVNYTQKEVTLHNNIIRKIDSKIPILLVEENAVGQSTSNALLEKIKSVLETKGFSVLQIRSLPLYVEVGQSTADLILETLTGYIVKKDKFQNTGASQFSKVYYYDNNQERIKFLKKINEIIMARLDLTIDSLADQIHNFVNEGNLELVLNTITSNELNPITSQEIKLSLPMRFLNSFEKWNFSK